MQHFFPGGKPKAQTPASNRLNAGARAVNERAAGGAGGAPAPIQNVRIVRHRALQNTTQRLRNAENALRRNPNNQDLRIKRNLARNVVGMITNSTNDEIALGATGTLPNRFKRAPRKRHTTRRRNNRK